MDLYDMNPSTKKVLIFDDNPIWLKTLKLWCSHHYGFNDITCSTNEEHILNFTQENYTDLDLIIIDFYNGNKDTTELINKIRKINKDFLIVVVSADFINDLEVLNTKEMMKALTAGATRVSIKDINKLKEVIFEHLEVRESEVYETIKTTQIYNMDNLK